EEDTEEEDTAEEDTEEEYSDEEEDSSVGFKNKQKIELLSIIQRSWDSVLLFVVSPTLPPNKPPVIHQPETLEEGTEFVYPIVDFGFAYGTSKAGAFAAEAGGQNKLHWTIEKIITLLDEKLSALGLPADAEIRVSLAGTESALRKIFESIINLRGNIVITNYDPGAWGDNYLRVVEKMVQENLGYPPEAPRQPYRQHLGHKSGGGTSLSSKG
ncbi:MAG: hypothetical protein Q8R79_08535, partial [Legionellaceae bacterium]|nr:hypothetical protein [Legionellaceae bacterium]